MCPKPTLEAGAIFIADAHENAQRDFLHQFFLDLEAGVLPLPPQLFLMGDMFDLLVGDISYTAALHHELIGRIDAVAQKIPVYYLEGNHDFNLTSLFSHVHVVPIERQPLHVKTSAGEALVLHGDKYGLGAHRLYTRLIRSPKLLRVLEWCDTHTDNALSKKLLQFLEQKYICKRIEHFESSTRERLAQYPLQGCAAVMEGHFHQGVMFEVEGKRQYINFPSFACDQSYFVVQCANSIHCAKQYLRGNNV
ncbi:MAG: metallophosphoesterase [Campylobacterales bacterium]|nr:metallophosphoesterase [Campylobacterales bacterium]